MKYFLDTEFIEGTQSKKIPFLNLKYGQTKLTIDLISIGIVSENNREYYAISKDFNLKEAWNRYQLRNRTRYEEIFKEYWIRDNILLPIAYELAHRDYKEREEYMLSFINVSDWVGFIKEGDNWEKVWYKRIKKLINKYGKTNKEIADEVKEFCLDTLVITKHDKKYVGSIDSYKGNPIFYSYYSAYDWVVFCWLFGKMIDLPKGFPMYCIDLKQMLDDKAYNLPITNRKYTDEIVNKGSTFKERLNAIKSLVNYPKQNNEHNALADAKWNLELYKFLNTI